MLNNSLKSDISWKLIISLLSKIAGHNSEYEQEDITLKQTCVAETTELLRTTFLLHQNIINYEKSDERKKDYHEHNKMIILIGDYLQSCALYELAKLKNQYILEAISEGHRNQFRSEFFGFRNKQGYPLPSESMMEKYNPPTMEDEFIDIMKDRLSREQEWMHHHLLSGGSLLAKGCQSVLHLAGFSPTYQKHGYSYGIYMMLCQQSFIDRKIFKNSFSGPFSLISLPLFYHLDFEPDFYKEIEKGLVNIQDLNYKKIFDVVSKGPGMEKTFDLQKYYTERLLNILKKFLESETRNIVVNMLKIMEEI